MGQLNNLLIKFVPFCLPLLNLLLQGSIIQLQFFIHFSFLDQQVLHLLPMFQIHLLLHLLLLRLLGLHLNIDHILPVMRFNRLVYNIY